MIIRDKNICGDCPTIKGTRITVPVIWILCIVGNAASSIISFSK